MAELLRKPIDGDFNLKHLQFIHKFIFQDLYIWAGKLREIRISKGITFAYPEYIKIETNKLFSLLKKENYLRGMPLDELCERLAYYKAELNMIHPFRDGNGRTIREFIR